MGWRSSLKLKNYTKHSHNRQPYLKRRGVVDMDNCINWEARE